MNPTVSRGDPAFKYKPTISPGSLSREFRVILAAMEAAFSDGPVHVLSLGEVDLMCRWAGEEGWNPGLNDHSVFRAADPEGFLGIRRSDGLAGTISAVRYGDDFAFVGFFIVRPGLRGHLIGPALARAAIARIDGIPTGIDGVLENVGKYERIYGFRKAWSNVRAWSRWIRARSQRGWSAPQTWISQACWTSTPAFSRRREIGF